MSKEVFILGGKRTAMGEYVGVLKDVSAIDLGAVAARGALERFEVVQDSWPALFDRLMNGDRAVRMPDHSFDGRFNKSVRWRPR